MTQVFHNSIFQVISARKEGNFQAMTQVIDNYESENFRERRGVEAHFHQRISCYRDHQYSDTQGRWVATALLPR